MLIGYARVSTADQNLNLQENALLKAGCEKIIKETASGGKEDRQGLMEVLEFARKGDTVVVWKLDRLGRSLRHLIETVALLQEKGIGLKSLQEHIDTTTSGGKLIFHLFSALAEFERAVIRERTQAGLTAARARGRLGGRPPVMDKRKRLMAKALYDDKTNTIASICQTLKVSRASLYKYLKVDQKM